MPPKTLVLLSLTALLLSACAGGQAGLDLGLDIDLGGGGPPDPEATPQSGTRPDNGLPQYALAITVLATLVLLALLAGITLRGRH
ncbi:MAG: hypothetical protein HYZ26_07455 [Chloroflexi bacterium]|nr:hypothetical protein [Chloroflexota bacterium]